jgi:shikimate kinase
MKLILIDGGPASGKSTLGELLVEKFKKQNEKVVLIDLDTYVEELNPTWMWNDEKIKEDDQRNARINFAKAINISLQNNLDVIAIGERFLTKEDITNTTSKLQASCSIYLYHLSVQFELRKQRLHKRGPHSLIDLDKDQKDRDSNPKWYGYIYENINSIETDAKNLFKLIQDNQGLLEMD